MLSRRSVVVGMTAFVVVAREALSQEQKAMSLRLVRKDGGIPAALELSDCLEGTLYLTSYTTTLPQTDMETLGPCLEKPFKMNAQVISAIPEGIYAGKPEDHPKLGWVIRLTGTGQRKGILVHVGNRLDDSTGCILFGTVTRGANSCFITESKPAMARLRNIYENRFRNLPVELHVAAL